MFSNLLMVKTITIKDDVYKKLSLEKRKNESFSDLFERLLFGRVGDINALKKLRGSVIFANNEKDELISEISEKRKEERIF
jgi:predicted CopG family antitoxin